MADEDVDLEYERRAAAEEEATSTAPSEERGRGTDDTDVHRGWTAQDPHPAPEPVAVGDGYSVTPEELPDPEVARAANQRPQVIPESIISG